MWFHLSFVLSILATGPVGGHATPLAPRWHEKRVKHSWNAVPKYWESSGHPPAGTTIDLYLALRPQRENALINVLHEVSNPRHAKYGAYLSKEQVSELVSPHPDTLDLINSWLEDHGVPLTSVSETLSGNWLIVTGLPVPRANDIIGASYQLYQHVKTNDTVLRTVSYSLPEVLHGHIQMVAPTTYFGSPRIRPRGVAVAQAKAEEEEEEEEEFVTPAYLRWLYNTLGYVPAAVGQNAIGIAGYEGDHPSPQDLTAFMEEFRTDGEDASFDVVKIKGGGYDPLNPGMEANLDLQFAEAMTYPTPNIFYSTGGAKGLPIAHWLVYVLEQTVIPQTMTTSYSIDEFDIPQDYAMSLCDQFAKLGARGVSVLYSTGDWGVGGGECLVRDRSGAFKLHFIPQFPATCPWVTAVGGTTSDSPEVAASFSGGGFSAYFPRPPYQANAVPPFLENIGDTHQGLFDPNGRGLPDISAQASHFVMVLKGEFETAGGTSAAVPTVAGIISLLNDRLISQGKPPLGFLNPWLYGGGLAGLNDIRSGSNPGCGTDGFPATIGWDPVTGLGTPDFMRLEELVDELEFAPTASPLAETPPASDY